MWPDALIVPVHIVPDRGLHAYRRQGTVHLGDPRSPNEVNEALSSCDTAHDKGARSTSSHGPAMKRHGPIVERRDVPSSALQEGPAEIVDGSGVALP